MYLYFLLVIFFNVCIYSCGNEQVKFIVSFKLILGSVIRFVVPLGVGFTHFLHNNLILKFVSAFAAGSNEKERNPGQEMEPLFSTSSNDLNTDTIMSSNFNALAGSGDLKRKLLTMRRK